MLANRYVAALKFFIVRWNLFVPNFYIDEQNHVRDIFRLFWQNVTYSLINMSILIGCAVIEKMQFFFYNFIKLDILIFNAD